MNLNQRLLLGPALCVLALVATPAAVSAQQPWTTDPPARVQPQPQTGPRQSAPAAQAAPGGQATQEGQQGQPKARQPATGQTSSGGAAQGSKGAAAAKSGAQPKDDAPRTGDAQLRQRIEQLEEQLADMQVLVGTLESLGRGGNSATSGSETFRGPSAAPAGGGGVVDQARLDSLETQMRAISDQLEQLAAQVRQLGRRSDGGSAVPPPATGEPSPRTARAEEPVRVPGFGSTTVTPGPAGSDRDPIGRLINATPPAAAPPASPAAAAPASAGPAATLPPAAANASSAKELYETAHGYLLQQDYGAAEAAFEEFLRRHPGDRLAADAQYWLGEALYVQRRYRPAGQAFLRVVEKHPQSNKVPNSILKLAQSLDQLGQKDCALFEELETRHPGAPADVKTRARALKQRVGC